MAGPITAYTLAVATGASAIGPDRSRLRSFGIYATDASTFHALPTAMAAQPF
jgi:hypothetical protein